MSRTVFIAASIGITALISQQNACSSDAVLMDTAVATFSDPADNYAGENIAFIGDIDGDGNEDIALGSPMARSGRLTPGAVYLFYGPVSGAKVVPENAHAVIVGEADTDQFGKTPRAAGDFNGDGLDDFVVGAYTNAEGGIDAGASYVFLGGSRRSGTLSATSAGLKLVGRAGENAGRLGTGVGDVNRDGKSDILISTYRDANNQLTGGAYLIHGSSVTGHLPLSSAAATLYGEAAGDQAGLALAGAGDVNNDGYADFLIGAENRANGDGAAYLLLGPITGQKSLSSANLRIYGQGGASVGETVAGVGDVNGDGLDDLLIGAPMASPEGILGQGCAYLFYGGSRSGAHAATEADVVLTGISDMDNLGKRVTSLGDWNGDGFADFSVSAVGAASSAGEAYVIFGGELPVTVSVQDADVTYRAPASGQYAGVSLDADRLTARLLIGAIGATAGYEMAY